VPGTASYTPARRRHHRLCEAKARDSAEPATTRRDRELLGPHAQDRYYLGGGDERVGHHARIVKREGGDGTTVDQGE
jgi:hypothetical protein